MGHLAIQDEQNIRTILKHVAGLGSIREVKSRHSFVPAGDEWGGQGSRTYGGSQGGGDDDWPEYFECRFCHKQFTIREYSEAQSGTIKRNLEHRPDCLAAKAADILTRL